MQSGTLNEIMDEKGKELQLHFSEQAFMRTDPDIITRLNRIEAKLDKLMEVEK